ncbi:hypothetical protein JAAARDRAFT_32182 [Jaapia argillacea MUCL 33604]|uniref:DUF7598 domain-containing protein n=1 Tax=Jaapia argillacea MUCL 33604 TaxID=933084 RepID=A0A067Q283_9AGAM|nr:hypothetical protein JAAARDRAFT_32182 [Jaapia argillacea MUCL 33604]
MLPPRGYIFIGLNIARALSIIALILVFCSSIVVMVHDVEAVNTFLKGDSETDGMEDCDYIMGSTVPNQPAGAFWAVLNRLLIIFQVIILILSELGWPAAFFERFFPVLGREFGLGPIGIFQCLIGATILSHHVDSFTLVSAFFLFSLGCLNMLLGLIFRESAKSKRSLTSWREQNKGILPEFVEEKGSSSRSASPYSGRRGSGSSFGSVRSGSEKVGYGFGRQGEKAAGLKGFMISKPVESLPRYVPRPVNPPRSETPPPATRASVPTFESSPTAI